MPCLGCSLLLLLQFLTARALLVLLADLCVSVSVCVLNSVYVMLLEKRQQGNRIKIGQKINKLQIVPYHFFHVFQRN